MHANTVNMSIKYSIRMRLPSGKILSDAVLLGKRFKPDESLAAGIAHEICPRTDMTSHAMAWIHQVVPPAGYDRQHLKVMREDVYTAVLDLQDIVQEDPTKAKI